MPIGTAATNRRAEFDVTNVPANGVLTAGSTSTTVNIPNTFDYIYAGAVGLQNRFRRGTSNCDKISNCKLN